MTRPLIQKGIGELEAIFAKNARDRESLRLLADELQYRRVPKAIALLKRVQEALHAATQVAPAIARASVRIKNVDAQPSGPEPSQRRSLDELSEQCIAYLQSLEPSNGPLGQAQLNSRLRKFFSERGWDEALYLPLRQRLIDRGILDAERGADESARRASDQEKPHRAPAADSPPSLSLPQAPVPVPLAASAPAPAPAPAPTLRVDSAPIALNMPLEQAYKELQATPAHAWESIELKRRQLVQQASPARTSAFDAERRLELEEMAKRANQAALSIWSAKFARQNGRGR